MKQVLFEDSESVNIRAILADDGDMSLTVYPRHFGDPGQTLSGRTVRFCGPGGDGCYAPRTKKALRALMEAVKEDLEAGEARGSVVEWPDEPEVMVNGANLVEAFKRLPGAEFNYRLYTVVVLFEKVPFEIPWKAIGDAMSHFQLKTGKMPNYLSVSRADAERWPTLAELTQTDRVHGLKVCHLQNNSPNSYVEWIAPEMP